MTFTPVVGKPHRMRSGEITEGVLELAHATDLVAAVDPACARDIDPLTGAPRARGPFVDSRPVFKIGDRVVCDSVHSDTESVRWEKGVVGVVGALCLIDGKGDCWIYFPLPFRKEIEPYAPEWLRLAGADEIAKDPR